MSTMASIVSSVCIMTTVITMTYLIFRAYLLAIQHAYKVMMLRNDREERMAVLRHEQAKENVAAKKAEDERRAADNAQLVKFTIFIEARNRQIEP